MRVLFRVDDGPGIGSGHIMRCFALAESLYNFGAEICLSTVRKSELHGEWLNLKTKVKIDPRNIGTIEDLKVTKSLAKDFKATWIVVDGYSFSSNWLESLEQGYSVLYIDDQGLCDPKISIVLNHNPGADIRYDQVYQKSKHVLLGCEWFLLRGAWKEFPYRSEDQRLLVTFGGCDPEGGVYQIMSELSKDKRDFIVDIVTNAEGELYNEELKLAKKYPEKFLLVQGPVDLTKLMRKASVVICGGGVTSIEAVTLGIQPVVVILSENQRPGMKYLEQKGLIHVTSIEESASLALDIMYKKAKVNIGNTLIDGHGTERVVSIMSRS